MPFGTTRILSGAKIFCARKPCATDAETAMTRATLASASLCNLLIGNGTWRVMTRRALRARRAARAASG